MTSPDVQLPQKQPSDVIVATFPFQDLMAFGEIISGCTVTVTLNAGTDANPSYILDGAPDYVDNGNIAVTQSLQMGLSGNIYLVTCTVTTSLGQTLVKTALLAVINASDQF